MQVPQASGGDNLGSDGCTVGLATNETLLSFLFPKSGLKTCRCMQQDSWILPAPVSSATAISEIRGSYFPPSVCDSVLLAPGHRRWMWCAGSCTGRLIARSLDPLAAIICVRRFHYGLRSKTTFVRSFETSQVRHSFSFEPL